MSVSVWLRIRIGNVSAIRQDSGDLLIDYLNCLQLLFFVQQQSEVLKHLMRVHDDPLEQPVLRLTSLLLAQLHAFGILSSAWVR